MKYLQIQSSINCNCSSVVNECIPELDKQSISLEWYELLDYSLFDIEEYE